jgi:hypothetical protein
MSGSCNKTLLAVLVACWVSIASTRCAFAKIQGELYGVATFNSGVPPIALVDRGWAVGHVGFSACSQSLGEFWSASWIVSSSPQFADLKGAAVVRHVGQTQKGPDVWAVGDTCVNVASGAIYGTLTVSWSSPQTGWQVVQSPDPPRNDCLDAPDSFLEAVAGMSPVDAWAVGWSSCNTAQDNPIIERWNGKIWQNFGSLPLPSMPAQTFNGRLAGVATASNDAAWAVGHYSFTTGLVTGNTRELIYRWNGFTWKLIPSDPALSEVNVSLSAVAAISPSDAWTVGGWEKPATNTWHPLTQHWNGSAWQWIHTPNFTSTAYLTGVAAISHNDVWAVGWSGSGAFRSALTLHWDGQRWKNVPVLFNAAGLNAVAAVPGAVWAVGCCPTSLRWNGTKWVLIPQP